MRVDEAEEPPLQQALQMARERFPRRGQPDTCLVISHANRMRLNEQHNRRLAPEGAVTLRYEGRAGAAGTNSPQTMRVWPGLRLVGAGGKVAKGCFVTDARRAIAPHAAVPRHHLRQLPGPHPAGPGAPVRHHEPALRAAPPVRGRLAGHQRRVKGIDAISHDRQDVPPVRQGLLAPRRHAGPPQGGAPRREAVPVPQDVRPHACTECDARFHKAADLKKHLAIHARKGFVHRSSREVRASGACGL